MKKLIYSLGLMIIAASCSDKKSNVEDSNIEETKVQNESISLVAQQRPFGEPVEFDMEVKKVIDRLDFTNPNTTQIDSTDLVIGMTIRDTQFAIPLKSLSSFEVANFSNGMESYTLTWCPIVGTARVFESGNDGSASGFDIGWGLNNNNLLLVDRNTKTVWNQLSGQAIHGQLMGEFLKPHAIIQSTWGFWKQKYPQTKLLINKDTANAIFSESINESPYYNNWKPGDGRPIPNEIHQIETLGLGINLNNSSVYFPFKLLFKENSPIEYEIENQKLTIHFEESGLTAWVEDRDGIMIPSSIVYDWAWKTFYPNTQTFNN